MLARIPAHIMVPENGTWVFCDGIDCYDVPFSDQLGRRVDGYWTLKSQEPFKAITHWRPIATSCFDTEFNNARTNRTVRPFYLTHKCR
jgi:hypothetical protein